MRRYCLDTDICSYLFKHKNEKLNKLFFREVKKGNVYISAITFCELYAGEYGKKTRDSLDKFSKYFIDKDKILGIDSKKAIVCSKILKRMTKNRIDVKDAMIAATALYNTTLVTNNEAHFRRVPGLRIENWLKQAESEN